MQDTRPLGIIVNPHSGRDARRLFARAGTSTIEDKRNQVTRIVVGAAAAGVERILLSRDSFRIAASAVEALTLDVRCELVETPISGRGADSQAAAQHMREAGCGAIVALGGDGTSRAITQAWRDVVLLPLSTGTNNVYPLSIDGTSAGVAAGLVASGAIDVDRVAQPTKRILVEISDADGTRRADDVALVDLALVDRAFVGARAVTDPATLLSVVAAIGEPGSTGMSSIAGRAHPVDRHSRGGAFITIVHDGESVSRRVRVPLSPGTFDTLALGEIRAIDDGEPVTLHGPGVLAFDGERDVPIGAGSTVTVTLERTGPRLIDVETTLMLAAHAGLFDATSNAAASPVTNADPDAQETTDAH